MKKHFFVFFFLLSALGLTQTALADEITKVKIKTSSGTIIAELYPKEAPITVANFLSYVSDGHYKDTIFHRVIPNFMIQGGGMTFDFQDKPTKDPIKSEAKNGLTNIKYTLAMARTDDPDSAKAQFFINVLDNPHLDKKSGQSGYTVFGKVIEGFDIVEKIRVEPTGLYNSHPNAPNYPVIILEITTL